MSAIQLRKQTNLVKEYWSEVCSKEELVNSPMNSSFYESVTKMTKTKLNNANLNNSGQVYLNAPKLNFNLPSNEVNLQPLNVSYEINANVRLLRSLSLKEARLGTFIKNKLASSEGTGASI
jgi:hypothetical protein